MSTETENKTYQGITASVRAWSRLGINLGMDGRPDYESDSRFGVVTGMGFDSLINHLPSLIARAIDSLPDGASGDKNIAALGRFGDKIPSTINVWHHVPELRAIFPAIPEETE